MKTFLITLGLAGLFAVAVVSTRLFAQDNASAPNQVQGQTQAQGGNSISFQTFYNQLSSQGTWIKTDNYGDVWQPTESDPNWRPYTYGQWVNTDQGMMWDSYEPFGWATYHYGRWVNLADHGWVWVPGYTWAPAWVSWRNGDYDGDDYCGWAPLPPDTFLGIDFIDPDFFLGFWGFQIGDDCDLAYGIGPGCYNFCPAAYLGDPHPWRHFADHRDNFAIINHTRNVTNLNVSNDPSSGQFGRVHSGGPGSAALVQGHVRNVQLTSTSSLAGNGDRSGNTLAVYAPNIRANSDAHPRQVSEHLGSVTVNHGTDINQPLAVNSHLRSAAPTSTQIEAAKLSANNASSGGMIARTDTTFSRTLSQPLTSYHPSSTAGTNFRPATTGGMSSESTFHTSNASSSAFTGESETHHTSSSSPGSSFFGGFFHRFAANGSSVKHESVYHSNPEPGYRSSIASFFHESAPSFHSSSSAYHPQSSFHASASSMHFGGGAPSVHFSGGSHHSGGGHSGGDKHH